MQMTAQWKGSTSLVILLSPFNFTLKPVLALTTLLLCLDDSVQSLMNTSEVLFDATPRRFEDDYGSWKRPN
jgi:hypothetical protein